MPHWALRHRHAAGCHWCLQSPRAARAPHPRRIGRRASFESRPHWRELSEASLDHRSAERHWQRDSPAHRKRLAPPSPPALTIPCLVHDDAVNPGPKRRMAAERVNRPEDAQEHFLRQIQGFVVVAQEVQGQLVDHPLVFRHQLGTRLLVPRGTALDQGGLTATYFRPGDGSNRLHRKSFCHLSTPRAGCCPTLFDPQTSELFRFPSPPRPRRSATIGP